MAENQDQCNIMQGGQVPEGKAPEVVNQDEFGEFTEDFRQRSQDQQQYQEAANNAQVLGRSNNVPQGEVVSNPVQDNQRGAEANRGEQGGFRRGSNGRGAGDNFRGRGGPARGRGG